LLRNGKNQTNSGDMDFVDGCHSGFPIEIIMSKLIIKIFFLFFLKRQAFSHITYIFLWKSESLRAKAWNEDLAKNPVFQGTSN